LLLFSFNNLAASLLKYKSFSLVTSVSNDKISLAMVAIEIAGDQFVLYDSPKYYKS